PIEKDRTDTSNPCATRFKPYLRKFKLHRGAGCSISWAGSSSASAQSRFAGVRESCRNLSHELVDNQGANQEYYISMKVWPLSKKTWLPLLVVLIFSGSAAATVILRTRRDKPAAPSASTSIPRPSAPNAATSPSTNSSSQPSISWSQPEVDVTIPQGDLA